MKKYYSVLLLLVMPFISFAQKMSEEETKLYNLIMEYRKENGLPSIPVSKSLNFVAKTHVEDLIKNRPDQNNCTPHSWSSKGSWTPCCYTPDHAQATCMWSKPRELTSYTGNGYEIAFVRTNSQNTGEPILAKMALDGWKTSAAHNAVIINLGIWKDSQWRAIGIAIGLGYAVVWFGEEEDK